MSDEMVTVQKKELEDMVVRRLTEVGMPENDARTVADVLVFADLRGTSSHGVLRVEHYANRVRQGGMNLSPDLEMKQIKPAVGLIDAAGGIGHVAARKATELAIEMAREHGLGLVGVQNSSHCGALAYYIDMALKEKMMAMVTVNTDAVVVPFGGRKPFFGTNPFAFGFPGTKDSMLLDMATSEVAFGKIFYAREKKMPIPEGWAVTKDGEATTDADAAFSLFPFGGHKGYGINMMVEALTGLLVGGVFGTHVRPMYAQLETYRNLSSFHLVIDPTLFIGDHVYEVAQNMIDELHAQPAAPGFTDVKLPGEIEAEMMKKSLVAGISIPGTIYDFLSQE
jgi:ureidoglycolate dehydrogenase (NAD+)